jgi:hypothetical protein
MSLLVSTSIIVLVAHNTKEITVGEESVTTDAATLTVSANQNAPTSSSWLRKAVSKYEHS